MLAKVGREIGPHLRRGQLVLSVLAGATTTRPDRASSATTRSSGACRTRRPASARAMTVWYATPETTETQRAQAAALLGALGHQLEVDDEKMVAMATAVAGTGPTYVFLVMEALIDAAVHLGFPRHIAHDLVIETLEGSHRSSPSSRGCTRPSCATWSPRPAGRRAAALHELESGRLRTVLSEAVWAAYRRTVELGDQLEASVGPRSTNGPEVDDGADRGTGRDDGRAPGSTCGGRRSHDPGARPARARTATSGPTRPPCGIG